MEQASGSEMVSASRSKPARAANDASELLALQEE